MNTSEQILERTGERSVRSLAIKLGMHQATLNRQMNSTLPIETLVAISRKCGADLADLLADAGHITTTEARLIHRDRGLSVYSDHELAEELYNRTLDAIEEREAS